MIFIIFLAFLSSVLLSHNLSDSLLFSVCLPFFSPPFSSHSFRLAQILYTQPRFSLSFFFLSFSCVTRSPNLRVSFSVLAKKNVLFSVEFPPSQYPEVCNLYFAEFLKVARVLRKRSERGGQSFERARGVYLWMEINLSSGSFETLGRSALEDCRNPLRKLIF